jgi:peptide/nickel transport system substrate-binding protein
LKLRPLALLIIACGAAVTLVACSKVGLQTGQPTSNVIPGTLRYADVEEPIGLNPLLRLQAIGTDFDMFIYGHFFNVDDKLHYVPELATVVPTLQNGGISKDGLTITYHLRHGVKWQDGEPFTSHDVLFTVSAVNNPKNNLQSREGWDHIKSVEAVGPYEVRIHLTKIYAPAIATFFTPGGNYPVLPAHLLEKYPDINHVPFNTNPVGTGPFKLVKWVHGDHLELAANPLYWRGPPKLQHIIMKIIPKETTIVVQLRTHEIDAWLRAPSNLYTEVKKLEPEYRVQLAPAFVYSHMDLNLKNPIFTDLRVRRAIHYAVNIPLIIHKVTHDVQVPSDAEVSKLSWAYNPNVMHYDFDPAKARSLLAEAGWKPEADGVLAKNGQRLAFNLSAVSGGATGEATVQLVQEELRAVGMDVKIKNYPAELFFAPGQNGGILQTGKYDIGFYSWVAPEDPDGEYSLYACDEFPPIGQNDLFWCDPAVTAALNAARNTYDQTERKRYYGIVQSEIASQSVTIVMWFQRQIFVTSQHFHNFKPAPATTSNWNTWEWSMQ